MKLTGIVLLEALRFYLEWDGPADIAFNVLPHIIATVVDGVVRQCR
jgi:hypothetical protein